jgi:hypothetical protein
MGFFRLDEWRSGGFPDRHSFVHEHLTGRISIASDNPGPSWGEHDVLVVKVRVGAIAHQRQF